MAGALFGVLVPYGIYPLWMIARDRQKNRVFETFTPPLTVVMAAHNEAAVIVEKIAKTFATDYPQAHLHFLIGTDACTDATDKYIAKAAAQNPNIRLVVFAERTGKVAIMNHLRTLVATKFMVATDANVLFQPHTLSNLMRHFSDPKVGLVAGHIQYGTGTKGIANQERAYLKLENRLKLAESNRWNLMMGAEGGCYAIRTKLMPEVPGNALVDDFYVTLQTITKKYQALFEPAAQCTEDVTHSRTVEFARKKRISAGNWQNLKTFAPLLLQQPYPAGFAFFCHKILRWLTPFFLLMGLFAWAIATTFWQAAWGLLVVLAAVIGLMAVDHYLYKRGRTVAVARFVAHFFLMNYALLLGFINYTKGIESSIWQRTQRNEK